MFDELGVNKKREGVSKCPPRGRQSHFDTSSCKDFIERKDVVN